MVCYRSICLKATKNLTYFFEDHKIQRIFTCQEYVQNVYLAAYDLFMTKHKAIQHTYN